MSKYVLRLRECSLCIIRKATVSLACLIERPAVPYLYRQLF